MSSHSCLSNMVAIGDSSSSSSRDDEVIFQLNDWIKVYRSGRVERLCGTDTVPAGLDPNAGVVSRDVVIDSSTGVSARLYLPTTATGKLPVIIYFHGGAFFVESPFSPTYHPHLNKLSSLAPLLGVSVDYRLAPEHPLPIAYEDSWAALQWVLSWADPWIAEHGDRERVYIAGDSAGGNIAQQMAVRAGEEGTKGIKGMALVHPYFFGKEPVGCEPRDCTFRSAMERTWRFTLPGTSGLDDPRINPVAETAESLEKLGCDKVLMAVAGKDIFYSRGKVYYDSLRSCGWQGKAELIDMLNVEHDFHIDTPHTEDAMILTKQLAAFFS